ncbi:uncharacterized protein N7479_004186 [Penicillium vulpinum]|uniref:3-phytase n=1 Tax=Penicillium vulpinum TaxID=29845 RepID=A0A1V6SBW2_9EURO|nr:uncharacterized protein N7479_004186 [Penicillium vulpinum]KAJ5964310.1 hypothetical protein N7479_004186 [Penicillium vulpinum]OQE11495.1 hypothetical protein PENVUL_c002G07036 [Penicillium vulpinum]
MAAFSKQHLEEEGLIVGQETRKQGQSNKKWIALTAMSVLGLFALAVYFVPAIQCNSASHVPAQSELPVVATLDDKSKRSFQHGNNGGHNKPKPVCNTVETGYQCNTEISRKWGQYSPYYSVVEKKGIKDEVPRGCHITFVQTISRHGARFASAKKSKSYAALMEVIQANATAYKGNTAFLRDYKYIMGGDDLVPFGINQMINQGTKFYNRYADLVRKSVPFIRSSDSERVVASGVDFIQGFQKAKSQDKRANRKLPSPKTNVIISEEAGANNTLNHNTCPKFEEDTLGDEVEEEYMDLFVPPIRARLQANLPGVTFTNLDVVSLMDLCPFETVALTEDGSELSPFCDLFTSAEWSQYDYLQTLSKYYGYGSGNSLGATQGVGFVNELIARLTKTPVVDSTSTNTTLDAPGAATFPLNYSMYADFTHDNGMLPIYTALGLYNGTKPLPLDHIQSASDADGLTTGWTVSFAARAYIEMMQCGRDPEPLVRAIVNDRVVPLHGCNADKLGRCRRRDFIKGLSYARAGGDWDKCYE